jgi:hypothetical protein
MPDNACGKTDREELIGYGYDGDSSGSRVVYFYSYLRSRDDGESEQVNYFTGEKRGKRKHGQHICRH